MDWLELFIYVWLITMRYLMGFGQLHQRRERVGVLVIYP